MAAKASRLNLRVPSEVLEDIEEISARKGFGSISDVVRDALEKYADDEADSWNSGIVKVKIPNATLEALEALVMAGYATDMSQAINSALEKWVDEKRQYHLEGRDAFRAKVLETIEEKAASERLKSAQKR
jgi:Arc/MetJ-type ribon-helix-helix transcriptional regulator